MTCQNKLVYLIFFSFCPLILAAFSKSDFIPQKLILVRPGFLLEQTGAAYLYQETENVLISLEAGQKISFLKERQWQGYQNFLKPDDLSALSFFYLKTGVTGIVYIYFEEQEDDVFRVNIAIFDLIQHKKSQDYYYYLKKAHLYRQIAGYKAFVEDIVLERFPPLDHYQIKKMKYKPPPFIRVNPDYQIMLSGGNGIYFKQASIEWPFIYSLGLTTYFNFTPRIKKFSFNVHFAYTAFWNFSPYHEYYSLVKNKKNYIDQFYGSIGFNGWFKNHVFRLGGGIGAAKASLLLQETRARQQNQQSAGLRLKAVDYALLFFFISFAVQPLSNAIIQLDVGSFLSPSHFFSIGISYLLFYYLCINLKYFVYKNLFIEFTLPFYGLGFQFKHKKGDRFQPFAQVMFNLGMGWRFAWSKK